MSDKEQVCQTDSVTITLDKSEAFRIIGDMRFIPLTDHARLGTVCCGFLIFLALLPHGNVNADIYRYVDEDGIVHFTDAPTDKRFKIFMRDLKKDKELRTRLRFASSANSAEYAQLIKICSEKYGVSQSLVKAVIQAESGFDPNAVSSKGASGLMQLMPATAKSLKVADRFDPKENVDGGVKYLRFLLDTFRGDVALAVAAYNAGLNRVAKYGGIPPYNETRVYVSRVLSYMKSYQESGIQ